MQVVGIEGEKEGKKEENTLVQLQLLEEKKQENYC